jgi:hypothetical protein
VNLDLFGHAPAGRRSHFRARYNGAIEWYTPDWCLDAVREVLGAIDLDPASSAAAQQRVQAGRCHTIADSGLHHPWHGRVFLNPPYRQPACARFVAKLLQELHLGRTTAAILLVNNCTDAEWFHAAALRSEGVCFTRKRIRFEKADGTPGNPPQGQAFLYFGPDLPRFARIFCRFGNVVKPLQEPAP